MENIEIKELLDAGVHYGHQRKKWNPKMKKFIYGDKDGFCIIDLSQTADYLEKACEFLKEAAKKKKNIIFVGTKRHISELVKEEATRCGAYYINKRWLGGLLTNFDTVRQRIKRLRELEETIDNGSINKLTKKEQSLFYKELEKLQKTLGGIKNMRGNADIVYVIDQQEEEIAIKEATKKGLQIVALVDTNCNPDGIHYPIPGNDDSLRSVRIITGALADAIIEGHDGNPPKVHDNPVVRRMGQSSLSYTSSTQTKYVKEVTVLQEGQATIEVVTELTTNQENN